MSWSDLEPRTYCLFNIQVIKMDYNLKEKQSCPHWLPQPQSCAYAILIVCCRKYLFCQAGRGISIFCTIYDTPKTTAVKPWYWHSEISQTLCVAETIFNVEIFNNLVIKLKIPSGMLTTHVHWIMTTNFTSGFIYLLHWHCVHQVFTLINAHNSKR